MMDPTTLHNPMERAASLMKAWVALRTNACAFPDWVSAYSSETGRVFAKNRRGLGSPLSFPQSVTVLETVLHTTLVRSLGENARGLCWMNPGVVAIVRSPEGDYEGTYRSVLEAAEAWIERKGTA